ncbi:MAG: hypothetical protein Q4C14_01990 [Bacillota bacterium]|nr:hypothetical protein [Bacillota bacterium]
MGKTETVTEFKCPCCGAPVEFNARTQNVKCPYCESEFDAEALLSYIEETGKESSGSMEWEEYDENSGSGDWREGETEGLRTYVCSACGGEIIAEETTGATSCPYCGNPVVITEKFSGSLRPDYIVPFKLDKKAAKEALKKFYKGKTFLPGTFKDENHIDEIKGMYVPFWLFDCKAEAEMCFKGEKVRMWTDGNFNYVNTRVYMNKRSGVLDFEKVPVDGSKKMDDSMMESIEPFDLREAVEFQTPYLAGYAADKYDVDQASCAARANDRIRRSMEDTLRATVNGFDVVGVDYSNIDLSNRSVSYVLLPVWTLNTTWKGRKYSFTMNGQTGRMAGDLPVDRKKFMGWLGLSTLLSTAAFFGLYCLLFVL